MDERGEGAERILVVDDNLQNRLVADGYLSSEGYEVVLASDGPSALALFERHAPDLVLLDVLMPGMNGFEVCRRIRELPGGGDVPIVFLTAISELRSYQEATAAGADDFLSKPITRTELVLRVRSLARIRRLQRALEARNAELLHAQEQRRRLGALVVHDLNSPLAAQILNCEYLLDLRLPDDALEAIADVAAASRWMQRLVLEFLDIHQAEATGLRVRRDDVDAEALVRAAFASVQRLATDVGQRLALAVDPVGLILHVDRDLFHRILVNLLDNCAKYAPRNSTVTVQVTAGADGAEVLVGDEGPGIPVEQRAVLFAPFGRLETTERRPSRGLGLTFCSVAVEAHGGTIEVVDVAGGRTAFRIKLPAGDPPR